MTSTGKLCNSRCWGCPQPQASKTRTPDLECLRVRSGHLNLCKLSVVPTSSELEDHCTEQVDLGNDFFMSQSLFFEGAIINRTHYFVQIHWLSFLTTLGSVSRAGDNMWDNRTAALTESPVWLTYKQETVGALHSCTAVGNLEDAGAAAGRACPLSSSAKKHLPP
jgi:hypothetical protein